SGMLPALIRRGAHPGRMSVTPNWPLRPAPDLDSAVARARARYRPDYFICLHAGNMGAKQGLGVLVDAARLAEFRELRIHFVLVGDGNQRAMIEALSRGITSI